WAARDQLRVLAARRDVQLAAGCLWHEEAQVTLRRPGKASRARLQGVQRSRCEVEDGRAIDRLDGQQGAKGRARDAAALHPDRRGIDRSAVRVHDDQPTL